jgi:D-alanyl-D-alanine carboxypeptidase
LWRDDLAVIGKTGWTREAKRCFVGAASAPGQEVIVAILGSRNLWADVEALVRYALARRGNDRDWQRQHAARAAALPESPAVGASSSTAWARGTQRVVPPPPRSARAAAPRVPSAPRGTAAAAPRQPRTLPQGDHAGLKRQARLRYHLHLATYPSRARAEVVARDLAKRGYRARVEVTEGRYRVTVRDFSSRDAARKAARNLGRLLRVDPVIVASR